MLHLVFQASLESSVLARLDVGDVVVFLENALLRAMANGSASRQLAALLTTNRLCVMADQLELRGIAVTELVPGIEVIGYPELVALTCSHAVIQSWT